MSITLQTIKCPECGSSLSVEPGRNTYFCAYCGNQIMATNDNEFIYHEIDEAGIKRAESEKEINLRKLELVEKLSKTKRKSRTIRIIICIVIGLFSAFCFIFGGIKESEALLGPAIMGVLGIAFIIAFGYIGDEEREKKTKKDIDDLLNIKIPSGIKDYTSKTYDIIQTLFESSGFTNISCVPLNDLRKGSVKKVNKVESITVNGSGASSGKKYPHDANVVILYHSIKNAE